MYKASYNSLFLRVLWTGEEGSRFRSSGGRSSPSDSNRALSSRIFLLFARSEGDKHMGQLDTQLIQQESTSLRWNYNVLFVFKDIMLV